MRRDDARLVGEQDCLRAIARHPPRDRYLVRGPPVVIRIGTSGWSYDHWHPERYPPGLPVGDRLARYAAAFPTAELNSSLYRWLAPARGVQQAAGQIA